MFAKKIVKYDAAVRHNLRYPERPFLTRFAGHDLSPERDVHFRPGPNVVACRFIGIAAENPHFLFGVHFRFVFRFSLSRMQFFFEPRRAHYLGGRCGRFSDRIEDRPFVLFFFFAALHTRILANSAVFQNLLPIDINRQKIHY